MKPLRPFLLASIALLFLIPPPAAGQKMLGATESVTLEAPSIVSPDTAGERSYLQLAFPRAYSAGSPLAPSPGTYSARLMIKEDNWKKRIQPYTLGGLILGGVAGYI
jgi:hypothetical protein